MNLKEFKQQLRDELEWKQEHPVLASIENVYDFFRYTIPRKYDDYRYEVKYAWQRVFRGYDNRFVWSHYYNHAELMVKVLTQFKKTHVGSPSIFFDFNTTNEEGHQKWEDILDKMIAGFQAVLDIEEVFITKEDGEYDHAATQKEVKKLEKVRDEGLKLYIKHYRNLWD